MKLRDFFLALSAGAFWLMLASRAELTIEAGRDIFSQANRLRHAGVKVKTASSATTKVRTCAWHGAQAADIQATPERGHSFTFRFHVARKGRGGVKRVVC